MNTGKMHELHTEYSGISRTYRVYISNSLWDELEQTWITYFDVLSEAITSTYQAEEDAKQDTMIDPGFPRAKYSSTDSKEDTSRNVSIIPSTSKSKYSVITRNTLGNLRTQLLQELEDNTDINSLTSSHTRTRRSSSTISSSSS